jgi:hypothetical protein
VRVAVPLVPDQPHRPASGPAPAAAAEADAAHLRLELRALLDREFLTIQLRTNTARAPGVDDTRVPKFNPLHPTAEQVADDERRTAVYRELISAWVGRTGHKS